MKMSRKMEPLSQSIIHGYDQDTAWAVREAIMNLLELVESLVENDNYEEREVFQEEVKKTVSMFAAAIVAADGKYGPEERALISHLVGGSDAPDFELSDLNEQSEAWKSASQLVPKFFRRSVLMEGVSRAILREIQFIGNNVCISDGDFHGEERILVSHYVAFLEDYLISHAN
jgi:hypothetical protein